MPINTLRMSLQFPIRHQNHISEEKSILFFRQTVPISWNINIINNDYWKDLNVEIAENGVYKGREFIVQLKSSLLPTLNQNFEKQSLKVSTYNYLNGNLQVVLLVKYIESENEAYWILFSDIPKPNQKNKTFTIRIPKKNKLSDLNWTIIEDHIRKISDKKLILGRT